MKDILIIGAGGNSMDVLDTINEINRNSRIPQYNCLGFLDDEPEMKNLTYQNKGVIGNIEGVKNYPNAYIVFTIGSPLNFYKRMNLIEKLNISLDRFETIVHPTASISPSASIGYGTVVLAHTTIASNAKLGNHIMILPNCVISHDDTVGSFSVIASSATISGNVNIGSECYIGANCSIIGGVSIGDHCLVGTGTVVIRDLNKNGVYAGNPARFVRVSIPE